MTQSPGEQFCTGADDRETGTIRIDAPPEGGYLHLAGNAPRTDAQEYYEGHTLAERQLIPERGFAPESPAELQSRIAYSGGFSPGSLQQEGFVDAMQGFGRQQGWLADESDE